MRGARRHITFANVVSLMALFFSMAGGAVAAHHYLINSTRQINPKVLRKLRGAAGEIGPVGPQGVTGAPGPKGKEGPRGEPAATVLLPGATENGDFGVRGAAGETTETLTFRTPLSAAVSSTQVEFIEPGKTGPNCKGPGQAAKGYLCLYGAVEKEVDSARVFDPETGSRPEGTGLLGFTLEVRAGAAMAYEGIYSLTDA